MGEVGELCCRGYNVMRGYYKMPEATAQVIDASGWLHSGDLGVKDENGNYRDHGAPQGHDHPRRRERLSEGDRGLPLPDPKIRDVQVVGVASEKYGEEVGGLRHLARTARASPRRRSRTFCRGRISRYKIPTYVFFVSEYPMTASGKIQKYKLRELSLALLRAASAGTG